MNVEFNSICQKNVVNQYEYVSFKRSRIPTPTNFHGYKYVLYQFYQNASNKGYFTLRPLHTGMLNTIKVVVDTMTENILIF